MFGLDITIRRNTGVGLSPHTLHLVWVWDEPRTNTCLNVPEDASCRDNDEWHGLSGIRHDETCRALNSLQAKCEQNGDCVCGSQTSILSLEPDTDEDGVPNDEDPDDDCDHLGDTLETAVGIDPLAPNDWWDLRPKDSGGIAVKVAFKELTSVDSGMDYLSGPDPYVRDVWLNFWGPDAPDEKKQRLSIPHFNPDDHPYNIGSSYTFAAGVDGWKETAAATTELSSDFRDLADWKWRQDDLKPFSSYPKGEIHLQVMDHDEDSDDDDMGSKQEILTSLYWLAGRTMAGSPEVPTFRPAAEPEYALDKVTVKLQLGADVCPAAVAWASLIAGGMYNVNLGNVPGGVAAC